MVTQEEDEEFLMDISKEELLAIIKSFKKDHSPSPDGWNIKFFLAFFDLMGEDLLKMVMEIKGSGKMPKSLKSTFIALIPKVDHPNNFGDLRPISLYNMLYKIVAMILALRLKPLLAIFVFEEKFGFLKNMHIHEVVGVS